MLFAEHSPEEAEQQLCELVVYPAQKLHGTRDKARKRRTEDGMVVHSFKTFLEDLAIATKDQMKSTTGDSCALFVFDMVLPMTPLQRKAFNLLGVKP